MFILYFIVAVVVYTTIIVLIPDKRTKEEKIYDELKFRDQIVGKWFERINEKKKD